MWGSERQGGTVPTDLSTAFVSYSRVDAEFALKLGEDLKAGGANVWLDQLDIEPGERWARAVQAALNAASRVLVILSPASVNSTNVEDEIAFALEKRKKVIPVLYQDCEVPFQLLPFQYVDFRADYARGLGRLLKTLAAQSLASPSPPTSATVATALAPALDSIQPEEQAAAATEKQRFDEEERERKAAERIRHKQEGTITAFDKTVQDGHVEQAPANCSIDPTSDEGDAAWEAERQRRQKELTKAIVAEWSAYGNVADEREESEAITKLKSALNAWLSQRPSGFESREAIRREQQEAAVRKAAETWRLRT